MSNLCIIGYCHLADGFLAASKALEKFGYNIFFFPYLSMIMDKVEDRNIKCKEFFELNKINVCLWWCNNIETNDYLEMISSNQKHFFFNWDPVLYDYENFNADVWKDTVLKKKNVYPLMDAVLTCFEREITYFQDENPDIKVIYDPPGFDSSMTYPINNESECKKYKSDISIVCTNLYDYEKEFPSSSTNIGRREIVDYLYSVREKIDFHIYGIEKFGSMYSECYKGFIKYDDCKYVFSNSRVNLSIHPMVNTLHSKNSYYEYYSERVPQILGCQGLLMTNSDYVHILDKDVDYLFVQNINDVKKIVQQIIDEKEKNHDLNEDIWIETRKNGHEKSINNMQWIAWANIFHNIEKDTM